MDFVFLFTTRTTRTPGPEVPFDCPACQKTNVPARTEESAERLRLWWLIPLSTAYATQLTCTSCGEYLQIDRPLAEVLAVGPNAALAQARERPDFLIKFCVVLGLVLAVIPVFGLVFSGIGLLGTFRKATAWKVPAWIGFVVSCLVLLGLGLLLAIKGLR